MGSLARRLQNNWHARIIGSLKSMMTSPAFVAEHRTADKAFTRERKLPLPTVIVFLLNQIRACLQTELNRFFKVIEGADVAVRRVTKGAFCQARKKLSDQAFVALNREAVEGFYRWAPVKRWRGYRLIAFDGTTHRLPQTKTNREHFGIAKGGGDKSAAVARVSCAFDVLNDVVVDASIGPYSKGERKFAVEHLEHLGSEDLVLMDQGYVATWLIQFMQERGVAFCCRIPGGQYKVTQEFRDSGKSEAVITLPPSRHAKAMYEALGLELKPIQVRIVRVKTDEGEDVFLLTSLSESVEVMGALYRNRWPVEELYKRIKCRIEVENFTGKLPHTIYQDFHATVLTGNLVAMLSQPAREEFAQDQGERQWSRRLNWTQVIGHLKDTMVLLFTRADIEGILDQLMALFLSCWESFRPDRHFPRNHRMNKRVYHTAYKPAY